MTDIERVETRGFINFLTIYGPTTYFVDGEGENGFDFLLAKSFADSIGVDLKVEIKINNVEKELAIKILRPNIYNIVNDELDALMFVAYSIENIFKKTKRHKLVEVISLLKNVTNMENMFNKVIFELRANNQSIEFINNWDISNVTNFKNMFKSLLRYTV